MKHSEYVSYDALGLAELIADGEISAAHALAAARARVDAVNPDLNAVIRRMDNIADTAANGPLANKNPPFAGVPFLLKDLFQDYAGVPSSHGNRALKDANFTPAEHAEITRRFIAGGVNDFLLTPTLAGPPPRIGATATPAWQRAMPRPLLRLPPGRALIKSGIVAQLARENLRHVPFTQLANLTGVPAMSVPSHWPQGGLPLGSQFVGAPGSEADLLRLAAQIGQAAPWFDRLPDV